MTEYPPPGGGLPPPPPPTAPPPPPVGGQPPAPGWWLASDGNWYPPHLQPGYPMAYPPQFGAPGTNGFAVAALVLGIVWLWWIGSLLAVIFGHVSLAQIKRTNERGRGMAIAGLVLGYIGIAVFVLAMIAVATGDSAEVRFDVIEGEL